MQENEREIQDELSEAADKPLDEVSDEREPTELAKPAFEPPNVAGKLFAVIGLARAGLPAARFLAERGARVIGYDDRPLEELGLEARRLLGLGVELKTGKHEFAGIDKCSTIVLSPGLKIHQEPMKSLLLEAESWGTEVIGELELAYRFCPAPIIAVTGTKGKSTTVKLIAEMMAACGAKVIRAGNTGVPLIAELYDLDEDSWAIVEVSSFQLERAPTFRPRVAVLLNLLPDHMDYHPTLFQYWSTKLKIFSNQAGKDCAIFNVDDLAVADLAHGQGDFMGVREEIRSHIMLSSARLKPRAKESKRNSPEEWLGWDKGDKVHDWVPVVPVEAIPLRGAHNLSNVAAALAALGAALGSDVLSHREALIETMRKFESLPHRLEIVAEKDGITWVNDSQSTIPAAAVAALNSFEKPITLIAGGLAKLDAPAYEGLGEAIASHVKTLITIGDAAGLIADIAAQNNVPDSQIIEAHTLEQAVLKAKEVTPEGGTVLLSPACASFDQFKSYEDRGEKFREYVSKL